MEMIFPAVCFIFGGLIGFMVRDHWAEKDADRAHQEHMGLYGDPNLAYWFRLRQGEADPYWASMPLREYRRLKQQAMQEDTL